MNSWESNGLPPPNGHAGPLVPSGGGREQYPGRFYDPAIDRAGVPGLAEYASVLLRRKGLVAALLLLGGVGGFIAVVLQPPVYVPQTTIEVQGLNENFMSIGAIDPLAGTGANAPSESNIETQVQILGSATLRRRVAERLQRDTLPLAPPALDFFGKLRARLKVLSEDPVTFTSKALLQAVSTIKAKPVGTSRIILVTCESTSPDIAASVLNVLANDYIDQTMESRIRSAQRIGSWLADRLQQAKAKLEESETRLDEFTRRSGLPILQQNATLAESKVQQLQLELSSIQAERIGKQTRYDLLAATPPESLPDIVDDPVLRADGEKLAQLKQARAALLTTVTPLHVKVVQLDAQIAEVQEALRRERDAVIKRARIDLENTQRREKTLGTAYTVQHGSLASQATHAVESAMLRREADTNRQLYQVLLQQLNQTNVLAATTTNTARVVDAAVPPLEYAKPRPALLIPVCTSAGLVLGCLLAVFLNLIDRRLSTPAHTAEVLKMDELGVIPRGIPVNSLGWFRQITRPMRKRSEVAASRPDQLALLERDGTSALAESFRHVVTSILFRTAKGVPPKVIMVTSPNPREGKTTVAANMAVVLAETGRRVLLVDSDLHRPHLHRVFGVPRGPGLSELLGPAEVSGQPPSDFIEPTKVPGVLLLQAGGATKQNLPWFPDSPKLLTLVGTLRSSFDVVLIDTAPILLLADARLFARLADGVVLVVRAGITDRESAERARRCLDEDGAVILGTVLNDWDFKKGGYGSYPGSYSSRNTPKAGGAE